MVFVDDQYCADRYNVFPGYFQPRSMICSHEERDRGGPCTVREALRLAERKREREIL